MDSLPQLANVPAWQREKALALHEICGEVEREAKSGVTIKRAVHGACIAHAGRVLEDGKGHVKTLPLSEKTLTRHYGAWKRAGENITVFIPDYKPGRPRMPRELIQEFHRLATLPGVSCMSVAAGQLKRNWRNGEKVPGLGTWQEWWAANRKGWPTPHKAPDFPFSGTAFYRHKPSRAERVMGTKGTAAARKELPWMTRDTSNLRPGEVYMFDDLRLDLLAIDDITKKPTELQTYIAYEVGCRMIPAFVMRPANAMLKTDVDALVVRTLQTFGLGNDYATHLVFERGTLTMSPAAKDFLERVSEGAIEVHYTSMNTGRSYVGAYRDKGVGHWMGKGVIESLMRKIHLALMDLPGQRGNNYAHQPASLGWEGQGKPPAPGTLAREAAMLAEIEMWTEKRVRLNLGLMWASQVTAIMHKAVKLHNADRDHNYQGFGQLSQRETAPGVWEDLLCCN